MLLDYGKDCRCHVFYELCHKSRKCTSSISNLSTVNRNLLWNEFKAFNILSISSSLTNTDVSSTHLQQNVKFPLFMRDVTTTFSNSVKIILASTGASEEAIGTPSHYWYPITLLVPHHIVGTPSHCWYPITLLVPHHIVGKLHYKKMRF